MKFKFVTGVRKSNNFFVLNSNKVKSEKCEKSRKISTPSLSPFPQKPKNRVNLTGRNYFSWFNAHTFEAVKKKGEHWKKATQVTKVLSNPGGFDSVIVFTKLSNFKVRNNDLHRDKGAQEALPVSPWNVLYQIKEYFNSLFQSWNNIFH